MADASNYLVGVDLGGTKIATALLTVEGKIVRRTRMDTLAFEGPEAVIDRIVQSVREVRRDDPIIGVGVGSPGPLDGEKGIILYTPNLPGWKHVPLTSILADQLHTDIRLANDANAAAWGEFVFGAGKGTGNMVYITVSTGIGSGIVIDGNLFVGSRTFAGELGHMIVDPNGPVCGCGNKGCWEACASGTAIGRYASEAVEREKTIIAELATKEGVPPSAKHVFQAVQMGDPVAKDIFDQVVRYLAIGLTNIVHAYNPERIVIGGGVSKAGDFLFEVLRQQTNAMVMPPYEGTFDIVPAKLGDDVGTLGAAALFLRKK